MTDDASLGGLRPDQAEREIYEHILSRAPEDKFDPTIDRVREACDLLGNPQRAYRVVHLTGTNGKTSTARMIESLVRAHGLRTGLFTSPHLSTVRERIQIDGEPISVDDFVRLWLEVAPIIHFADAQSLARGGPRLSFFEVLTVLAFAAFADAPIDVAVIEVGLGGSFDATNVADGEIAVIAPIAIDHTRYLGDSLAGIAQEKAGIIKDDATVVLAAQSESVTPIIRDAVTARGARLIAEDDDIEVVERQPGVGGQLVALHTPAATYTDIFVPLHGPHQAHNALLALAAAEALLADGGALAGDTVEEGFAGVTSPGRLEVVRTSPMVLVDAAHNPHGASALVDALEDAFLFDSLVGVVAVLEDKDAEGILSALEPALDHIVVTASLSPRALEPDDLAQIARSVFGPDRVSVENRLPDAIDRATAIAEGGSDLHSGVIITGSITLVGEARVLFGTDTPRGRMRSGT